MRQEEVQTGNVVDRLVSDLWTGLVFDPFGKADSASSVVLQFFRLSVFMYQATEGQGK